jgi:hypothetical protein
MGDLFVILLSILAVLIIPLWMSLQRGLREDEAKRLACEELAPRTVFDTSAITPRLKRLREDYVAAARSLPRPGAYRRGLLAAAQREIASLSYFRQARSEYEAREATAGVIGR